MCRLAALALAAALFLRAASATAAPTCGAGTNCPASAPCCSAYGQCGVGAYCLGGCDPLMSHSIDSCVARPTCQNADYKLTSLSDVQSNTIYLGDASKANWVSEGTPVVYQGNSILLTMAQNTVGTLLSSTHYIWYGKISARLRSSAGQGVVTAFIMMSDVKDEIDFEFVGADLQHVQSNFYWQGVLNYTNSQNLSASTTNKDWHTYTFDWTPDSITWLVDGTPLRKLNRVDTYNATTGTWDFPQTPARIMLSLWPAGLASNGKGTVDWAGGLINWNSPYMSNGYYYAQISEVTVQCYNPPPGAIVHGSKSYVYESETGLNNSVAITNDNTILASFYATGQNEGYNPHSKKPSKGKNNPSGTSSAVPASSGVQTVPGDTGAGQRGIVPGSSGGGSGSSGGSSGTGFSQGLKGSGSSMATTAMKESAMHGSVFAVLVALVALIML